jgi:hypothetical protein
MRFADIPFARVLPQRARKNCEANSTQVLSVGVRDSFSIWVTRP